MTGENGSSEMTFTDVMAVFSRREKCFVTIKGHNADSKYVVTRSGYYKTSCGDHLTRAVTQVLADAEPGQLDVTVWTKP